MDAHELGEDQLRRLERASSLALDPVEYAEVPSDVTVRLRSMCLGLPDATENQAWAGTQWRIRRRIFVHVLAVDFDEGPVTVMSFRSSGPELDALRRSGLPFFRPAWGTGAVGMVLDLETLDWDEVGELVTESYCALAPKKLVALIDRPTP